MSSKYSSFFNRDFYPTPASVLDLMLLDFRNEIVLEPSAGKGNIIDYAREHGAKDILFCEINQDLATICKTKARFLQHDFFKVQPEEISHVTLIVMNPPFSEVKFHIEHAWKIAPEGCQIVSLCSTSLFDSWRYDRSELRRIIDDYGNTINLGNVFNLDAERKTDVGITCVKLFKPIYNDNMDFEGFYLDEEPEYQNQNGIIKYNEIQALVNNYVGALKLWDEFDSVNERMNRLCSPVGMDKGFSFEVNYNKHTTDKREFAKELQKKSWQHIFRLMKLEKYMTSGVMNDINRFVETQTKVPFTVKNIYRMIEIIIGTAESNFNRALVEAVDELTKHTHENRYNVEGWKTNCGWMLNKKFIIDWIFETTWSSNGRLTCRYNSNTKKLDDLEKVLCNLTGRNYDNVRSLDSMVLQFNGLEPNRWYCNGFFEVKGFKKGTAHIKFQNHETWELLNRKYAELKGMVLFEGKVQSKYEDQQTGRAYQEKKDPAHAYKPNANLFTQPA